jgi:hypothetical protein
MVEIMVSFPHRKDSRYKVVAWRVLVVIRRAAEVVSNGVDTKCALGPKLNFSFDGQHETHMMTRSHAKGTNEKEPAFPVTPQQARNDHWKQIAENSQDDKVPSVLPLYERVLSQVRNISWPCF